jgi:hypothetical protein
MGACSSGPQVEPENGENAVDKRKKNREIENQLQQQALKESMKFKLLLLGTGESGKR